jgi:hypothetical protein
MDRQLLKQALKTGLSEYELYFEDEPLPIKKAGKQYILKIENVENVGSVHKKFDGQTVSYYQNQLVSLSVVCMNIDRTHAVDLLNEFSLSCEKEKLKSELLKINVGINNITTILDSSSYNENSRYLSISNIVIQLNTVLKTTEKIDYIEKVKIQGTIDNKENDEVTIYE